MRNVEETAAKLLRARNLSPTKVIGAFLCALLLMVPAMTAAAAEISGKVINKTTGKPAVADEVVLIDVSADMSAAARTRTDSSGKFQFRVAREGTPSLIAVTHAGVRYESAVSPGKQSMEIEVFDKTGATADLKSSIQVIQLETDADHLRTTEMFTLMNSSNPPRTIQKEELFSIPLPPGAVLLSSLAEAPGGSVVKSVAVVPPGENRCYFNFPLRPGTTRIQLQYQLPYSPSLTLTPYLPFPAEMFGIVIPASIEFQPTGLGAYTRQPDGNGGMVELIRNVQAGNAPSFTIAGTGAARSESSNTSAMLPNNADARQKASLTTAAGSHASDEENSPTSTRLLWTISLAVVVMICSTIFLWLHRRKLQAVNASANASMSQEVIREQLFSLELDRLENRISKNKYATARSLLEKKLAAALARATGS